jgi:hypothetical protein
MSQQHFLGVGWDLALTVDDNKRVKLARYEESIRQSIWIILSTSPGEHIMRPTFGSNLQDLLFQTNDSGLASAAASAVSAALKRWEPRITVLNVSAYSAPDAPNVLHIDIHYQVRATNSRHNLVYPFYLEQA